MTRVSQHSSAASSGCTGGTRGHRWGNGHTLGHSVTDWDTVSQSSDGHWHSHTIIGTVLVIQSDWKIQSDKDILLQSRGCSHNDRFIFIYSLLDSVKQRVIRSKYYSHNDIVSQLQWYSHRVRLTVWKLQCDSDTLVLRILDLRYRTRFMRTMLKLQY